MTDTNTFNYQDYVQGQTINLGTNQVISSNTQIDPSTYIQGDTAVLQASAGLENVPSEHYDYFTQNNQIQPTTYDTNVNYGETFRTTTEIPQTYEQTFQGTTNVIDGNNYFGDTNGLINNVTSSNEVQGTNIDLNSYFNNNNTDTNTNIIYGQTQIPQTTTTTTTTTEYNTLYGQNPNIQGTTTYGETQILPTTDTNTYINTETYQNNQIDYGQPTKQNEFVTYQTGALTDLNNYNFDTTNYTQQINTTGEPITQTTTTTNITTEAQPIPQYQTQNYTTEIQNQNYINNIPLAETQYIQPQQQYDISQFQTVNTIPTTTQITQEQTNIPEQTQFQTTQNIINTYNIPVQQEVQAPQTQIILKQQQVPNVVNKPQPQPQPEQKIIEIKKNNGLLGFPLVGRVIDEDFRRGRPIYSDIIRPSNKLKVMDNRITYKARNMNYHENIGLSRLSPSMSYDRFGQINSSINPNINSNIQNNVNNQINPINQINQVNNNVIANVNNIGNNVGNAINNVNNNINAGLDRITKASSYNVGPQSITPILNNVGLNQNNTSPEINKNENLKNFF